MNEALRTRTTKLWDPASEVPFGSSRLIWLVTCLLLCLTLGQAFLKNAFTLKPLPREGDVFVPDFFQDYASARNLRDQLNPYTNLDRSARLYLNVNPIDSNRPYSFKVNAHPPSSIFLCLPLADLNFPSAFLAWNAASLVLFGVALLLIVRQLDVPLSVWSIFTAISLILPCTALWQNLLLGQYAPPLLYLLVVVWAADRSERPLLAGAFLALATAAKLLPGLLFLYFTLRKRWRAVVSGLITSGLIAGTTLAVFGKGIYLHYWNVVYPRFSWFQNAWTNTSIAGLWSRLFDTAPMVRRDYYLTRLVLYAPNLALVMTIICDAIVLIALVRTVVKARTLRDQDMSFGLAIVAMLLVTPLAWPHYLLLLILPFLITRRYLQATDPRRWIFLVVVYVTLFYSPERLISLFLSQGQTAPPFYSFTLFPLQFYFLVLFFFLVRGTPPPATAREGPSSHHE